MPEPAVEALPEWVECIGQHAAACILVFATAILFWGLSSDHHPPARANTQPTPLSGEERFVPALSVLSDVFNIPDDVAGATLMAAGASSPEVFSSLVSLFITHSSLGAGTVIGSEQFNLLGICAGSVLYAKGGKLELDRSIVLRESSFYLLALILLILALTREHTFMHGHAHIVVRLPWALILLFSYSAYVFVCANFEKITAWFETRCRTALVVADKSESGAFARVPQIDAADAEVSVRMRKTHVLSIEKEPQANFEADEDRPASTEAIYASIHESSSSLTTAAPFESVRSFVRPATLQRLNSTATLLVDSLGLGGSTKDELGDVVDMVPSIFACYLFRQNRFYSRAKASKHAWELRWCVLRVDSRELHTFCERADADHVDFWTSKGARRYKLLAVTAFDRNRGLLELEFAPIGREAGCDPEPRIGYFLAPSKHVLEGFLREAEMLLVGEHIPAHAPPRVVSRTASTFDEGGEAAREEASLIVWPRTAPLVVRVAHVVLFPAKLALHLTILDVRTRAQPTGLNSVVACFQSVVWLAVMSLGMCACCELIGDIVGLSDAVIGITFSAIGTSLPNLISSMVVARQGLGNMAVSNALGEAASAISELARIDTVAGSNTFNILVGLGGPWLLYCISYHDSYSGLPAEDIVAPVLVLIATLAVFLLLLQSSGFVLRRVHAVLFIIAYLIFLVWAIANECVNS